MPETTCTFTHAQLTAERARYTGEPLWAAQHGIRRKDLGLDQCNQQQLRLRALLALRLLNTEMVPHDLVEPGDPRSRAWCDVRGLLANTVTYSPRYNDFAILTNMPGHLAKTLAGFPGIRVDGVTTGNYRALRLRHLPTGSFVSFRYVSHTLRGGLPAPCRPVILACREDLFRSAGELTARESDDLAAAPRMSSDVETLLSGLLARMRLAHPDKKWAVRELIWGRENRPDQDVASFSYCWGIGDEWVVRWGGRSSVPATDVAWALTDPFAGVGGATARHFGPDRCEVRLGSARLRLERRDVERGWEHDRLGTRS